MRGVWRAAALLALAAAPVMAAEPVPQLGRYMPMYPGMYLGLSYAQDEQDRAYDSAGEARDSAIAQYPGPTRFPESRAEASFAWYFPMFESYGIPFVSSRLHTARVTLRYAAMRTEGALAGFIADTSDDARTDADDLRSDGSGIGDLRLEFGTFLWGSGDWRTRERTPFAALLLVGGDLPFGNYDRDAPVSAGGNTADVDVTLGLHAQPWRGAFLDAAYGYRAYFKNQDPAFGALAPAQQGDDQFWNLSLGQQLFGPVYATVFISDRKGDANIYEDPRFTPNDPPPPDTTPESDNHPTPGRYADGGTALRSVGASLSTFLGQRWLLGLHYTHPISGASGAFELPYTNRQPAGCTRGSVGCDETPGETVRADGYGAARAYASDRLTLTLNYNFGLGDAFTCAGCKQQ